MIEVLKVYKKYQNKWSRCHERLRKSIIVKATTGLIFYRFSGKMDLIWIQRFLVLLSCLWKFTLASKLSSKFCMPIFGVGITMYVTFFDDCALCEWELTKSFLTADKLRKRERPVATYFFAGDRLLFSKFHIKHIMLMIYYMIIFCIQGVT